MKTFLFLDDTQERHDIFNKICQNLDVVCIHSYTAAQAITELGALPKFDCVFLDHDLEETCQDENGQAVAEFIALHMDFEKRPKNIVIHSWNPDGARAMENILLDNGVKNVKRVPFTFKFSEQMNP